MTDEWLLKRTQIVFRGDITLVPHVLDFVIAYRDHVNPQDLTLGKAITELKQLHRDGDLRRVAHKLALAAQLYINEFKAKNGDPTYLKTAARFIADGLYDYYLDPNYKPPKAAALDFDFDAAEKIRDERQGK